MKPDLILKLGDIEFSGLEIPQEITWGGDQRLAVHELVGGKRVVDAMGRSDFWLQWAGVFRGQNALARARYVDGLRIAGKAVKLTFGEMAYTVVIQTFHVEMQRIYQQPYKIVCVVVEDLTKPTDKVLPAGVDAWMADDMKTAGNLIDSIGSPVLSSAFGTLKSAVAQVTSFANAAKSTLNSVLQPIEAVRSTITGMIGSVGTTINSVATLGGILPFNPIATQVSKITSQAAAMTQQPLLIQLQTVMGRMSNNINSIPASAKTITVAGGNLYTIASQQYGDATSWTVIANANNMTDPVFTGVQTLIIPPPPTTSTGVLTP